jgi:hypothetical protein
VRRLVESRSIDLGVDEHYRLGHANGDNVSQQLVNECHGRKFGQPLNNQTSSRKTAPYSFNTDVELFGNAAHGCSSGVVSLTDRIFDLGRYDRPSDWLSAPRAFGASAGHASG